MKVPRFAFVVLSSLVASPVLAAPIKVACVGDSITQLFGWPDKLGAKLGAGYVSTNYGLAGTTLLKSGDQPYWKSTQFTQSHAANPDVVVIMLGTNDSKACNWDAHKGEFVGDYQALVDSYASLPSHPKIYLSLCPPAGANGFQVDGAVIEGQIIPAIKEVAAARGLPTIDVFDAFGAHPLDPTLYAGGGDLVHPSAKGAQLIADTVYAALAKSSPAVDAGADAGEQRDATERDASGSDGAAGAKVDASPDADASAVDAPSVTGAAGMGSSTGGGAGSVTSTGTGGGGAAGTSAGGAGAGMTPTPRRARGGCAVGGEGGDGSGWTVAAGLVALALWRALRSRRSRCELGG